MTSMGRKNWSDPEVAKPMLDKIPLGKFAGTRTCSYYTSHFTLIIIMFQLTRNFSFLFFGFILEPEDVADAIIFLLSDKSRMLNGITMPVDGGFCAV